MAAIKSKPLPDYSTTLWKMRIAGRKRSVDELRSKTDSVSAWQKLWTTVPMGFRTMQARSRSISNARKPI
jgi:hypothetical protein